MMLTALTVCRTGAQSIPGGMVLTKVEFDTVVLDNASEWDSDNHRWVCKEAGLYAIELHCQLDQNESLGPSVLTNPCRLAPLHG